MVSYNLPNGWLRSRLERSGQTQLSLAQTLDIDPASASRLLNGQRRLKFDELPTLVRFLEPHPGNWQLEPGKPIDLQVRGTLEAALKTAGLSPAVLAAVADVDEGEVLMALTAGGPLTGELARKASHVLGVSQGFLEANGRIGDSPDALYEVSRRWTATGPSGEITSATMPLLLTPGNAPGVPIYAAPVPGRGGLFDWSGRVVENRLATPVQSVVDAWGVFVGEGISRFRRGDVLFIHPHRSVRAGDLAVAKVDDRIAIGEVSPDGAGLLGADGKPIRGLRNPLLEKVVAATFD